ncbi:hypothetical protein EIP91_001321 [Steccherinum ochraceum]|uniref:Major facilitator superfamily (MFS) profile domain-containing protein n=1 Tax=Steccherinum ochraceum TaxID=92696 RepID=A0A4R0RGR4_9APHY|nr:hypothetical protein EIP91_001321 [Steccherinum ochraceum]
MQKVVICGTGFLGSNIAKAIATATKPNRMVQVSSRNPERIHRAIRESLPPAAQGRLLAPKAVDITDPSTLALAFENADVIVSLVGLMYGSPADFERIQWRGAENVARAAKEAGAKLIHISAIGADAQSAVPYERTKALGEQAVFGACPDATVIRPSLVFGPEDDFFNRFAKLSRVLPFMPVFGGGVTLFQPVYVMDIANLVELLSRGDNGVDEEVKGKVIEAGGPDVLSYRQLMELILKITGRWRPIVSVPFGLGLAQAAVLEKLPNNLFTLTRSQGLTIHNSPLTSNSYFPAIPTIANVFHVDTELVNLTVTVYMIFQGVSPMVWGPLSDKWGRRLMFIGCLLLLSISCVGVALTPTDAYWLLLVLRCVQAAGSASTVAIGAGVIGDIAVIAERGNFFGVYSIGPMVGPAIGPVIGGGIAQSLGWRAIFWFLCIAAASCMVLMILVFPETLRAIVGDGSIPPPRISRPVIPIIGRHRESNPDQVERPPKKPFVNPIRLFFYPEVTLLLLFNGVIYCVFYGVTASISTLFQEVYPYLNETDIGLCFLAIGGGMCIGTICHGRFLDKEYRVLRAKLIQTGALSPDAAAKDENFPIEVARFRTMPIWVAIFSVCCVGYGWALQRHVNIAVPLLMNIIMGYTIICVLNTTQTLIVDMLPSQGSSITACNNLARCSLGAGMVSVIDVMINSVGIGWTYVILGVLCWVVSPIIFVIMRMGPKWRARRRAREAAAAKAATEKTAEKTG